MSITVYKSIPDNFATASGKNLPALLQGFDNVGNSVQNLIEQCIDQLFTPTASGRYLVNLGEEQGFTLPRNSGLDIRAYRALVPIMASAPKQVRNTIEELVAAFYGNDRTHPSVLGESGPYQLISGDDLSIETESGTVSISITEQQVSDLTSVSASEIAAIFNSVQSLVLADTVTDRTTGAIKLRLLSKTAGAGAYLRITGGTLQNLLHFPQSVATTILPGTVFNLTQTADLVRWTWDNVGTNPMLFLIKKDDVVTVRGLVAVGLDDFQLLNGSHIVVNSGYDYFEVRIRGFSDTPSTLTVPDDHSLHITSSKHITLFDRDEYAFLSETNINQLTVTVPAVPPLARRHLAGSAHLHGFQGDVVDFTRSALQFSVPIGADVPEGDNQFVLRWIGSRYNFRSPRYKTVTIDNNVTQPTFTLNATDETYKVLPYTNDQPVGPTNPLYGIPGSNQLVLSFDFAHGLHYGWGLTLAGATGAGNLTSGQLNTEHTVFKVVDKHTVIIRPKSAGLPVDFTGISWGVVADVVQYASIQSDGSDMKLQFATAGDVTTSGLTVGGMFRLSGGTDLSPVLASRIRANRLVVKSIAGSTVNFFAGVGPGPAGTVITGATGNREGAFGGGGVTYRFDKTTDKNAEILGSMKLVTIGYQRSSNPLYVGSYLYDETGQRSTLQVGRQVVALTTEVFRGDNVIGLQVDGSDFPQSGQLVMEFGSDRREGPIRFFATVSSGGSTQILIDPAYRFQQTHLVGSTVQVVTSTTPHQSNGDGTDYPFYLTGTAAARNTMFDLLDQLVALGVFVNRNIILPDLRYVDAGISPFD